MSDNLKTIKRHYKALKNLRADVRNMIPMETYRGQGELLVRTYTSLHQAVAPLLNDPVIDALIVSLPEEAKERDKATHISILLGQLLAHVEAHLEEMGEESSNDGDEKVVRRFRNVMDD